MGKKILIIIILSVLFSAVSLRAQAQDGINWLTFEQLADSLNTKPKKVLVFFHTDWCSYCKKMLKETFIDPHAVEKINADYYAVHFDAEAIDSITFDNLTLSNTTAKKRRGQYHQMATLLMPSTQMIFPTTLLLDADFKLIESHQKYLSTKDMLKIL